MQQIRWWLCYLLLFPGLGVFYFVLFLGGQADFGPIRLGSIEIHEFEQLRFFGAPSLANVVEIYIAGAFGAVAVVALALLRSRGSLQTRRAMTSFVAVCYGASVLFYLLMPTLDE